MRLLDLIEEDHRIGPAAHRLGQLAALVITDVAGRRPDQARGRVALHELGHIEPDQSVLGVEKELGQRPGQLGLADARRAQEDEGSDRPAGVLQPCPAAAHGLRHRHDGVVLADHPLVQVLLHSEQARRLLLDHP